MWTKKKEAKYSSSQNSSYFMAEFLGNGDKYIPLLINQSLSGFYINNPLTLIWY